MKRTDIHRPSAIKPADYELIGFLYCGPEPDVADDQREISKHQRQTGGDYSAHKQSGIGNCQVCGATAFYLGVFYHASTNTYIAIGHECASKMDIATSDGYGAFKKRARADIEAHAGKQRALAILREKQLLAAWEIWAAPSDGSRDQYGYEEVTICDMVGKLVRYGSISENAEKYMRALLERIPQRAAIEAQRAAEREAAAPCPSGRVRIQGVVLAVKVVEGYMGQDATKILVKSDGGFKVWGSRFDNLDKGERVDFVATVEASRDDQKFGYFKRPAPYVSPEDKKAQAKMRKAQRAAEQAQHDTSIASNPDFYNPYSPDFGKKLSASVESGAEVIAL